MSTFGCNHPGGSIINTYHSPGRKWAARRALSFIPPVSVLEPEQLRQTLAERLNAVQKLYTTQE